MGSKKNVDMTQTETAVKIVKVKKVAKKVVKETVKEGTDNAKNQEAEVVAAEKVEAENKKPDLKKKSRKVRGKKYQAVRAQLDKTKIYDPASAIALVKKFSYAKFDASVEAHIVVREIGTIVDLTLPHNTGKSLKVVIADDQVLTDIEQGKINFDVLLASPELMPKLAKLAKILGPKGLMPNPKNGTLTPKPELKKKELEAGVFTLKTEKKAPLMHLVIGKVSMDDKMLEENIITILKALKNKILKLAIAPPWDQPFALTVNW
jgi:large subunit ribosomal protein L1